MPKNRNLKLAKTPGRTRRRYNIPKTLKWMNTELYELMLDGRIYSWWVPGKDRWHVRVEEADDWGDPITAVEMDEWLTS